MSAALKTIQTIVSTLVLLAILSACVPVAAADVAQSSLVRATNPDVPPADLNSLVAGDTAFAFDLYRAVATGSDNLFYSPYSISLALAMTYAGARDATAQEMAQVMHFDLPADRLHPAFNALAQELAAAGQATTTENAQPFSLQIANSIWGQRDHEWQKAYLDTLALNYGAGLRLTDFASNPDGARQTINRWVADNTANRIQDLIPPGAIDTLTRLVLANAIYFKVGWLFPFEKNNTQNAPFYGLDGQQSSVPLMSMLKSARLNYAKGAGYQAVELPYQGGQIAMTILLPDDGTFTEFEKRLDAQTLAGITGQLQRQEVDVRMPKFSFSSSLGLGDTLARLGMQTAFDPTQADFSGMDGRRDLFISNVFHKAFVAVDEAGTEAAAATAVVVGTTSMPPEPVRVTVDRPFIFLIRDLQSGTVLFVGRVVTL